MDEEYFLCTFLKALDMEMVSSTMNPKYQDTEELPGEPVLHEDPQLQRYLISRF